MANEQPITPVINGVSDKTKEKKVTQAEIHAKI